MSPDRKMYAVAVRDGRELYLFCCINRSVTGDVYVAPPRPDPSWNAHVSYHASTQYHVKNHAQLYHASHWQRPDATFLGTHNMSTIGIAAHEPRRTNAPCRAEDYTEVFEIPVGELSPETHRTFVSLDLMEPGGQPVIPPGAKILRQSIFRDSVPWIVLTLFETSPDRP
jgi:hypothetical protein